MNVKLEAALAYGRMRWRIFPCHSIVQTPGGPACSCGKPSCTSPGKHPRTRGGFKDATDDEAQIRRWWGGWPDANLALATGSGITVIDGDGPAGAAEFKALIEQHGKVPATLTAQTGRGFHLLFLTPPGPFQLRSSARGNVHVRGEGGYIIVAPSNHVSGNDYKWIVNKPLALMPDWLRSWTQGFDIAHNATILPASQFGPLPAYLKQNQRDVGKVLDESLKTAWSPSEQNRLISALAVIPPVDYQTWYQIGMALQQLNWERSDGSDLGFQIWDEWSQLCPDKYALAALEDKWRSFGRAGRVGVTLGTVYHMAREHGWNGGAPAPAAHSPGTSGHSNGANALPAAFQVAAQGAIFWPDPNEKGLPRSTCTNAGVAVTALEILCEKDKFHDKLLTGGHMIEQWAGDLSDDVIQMLRKTIRAKFGFDPGEKNVRDACVQLCLENGFDPILDYLDGLKWDGVARLDTWLLRYMGAPDTELNRMIGRLVLIAAVRRQYSPGAKFDQIVVLESKEGFGKSTAIEIMAGKDNFSDQSILNKMEREQQEAMTGVWLYEIADLTGMKKTEIEHIKAFASRTSDRARPAYGRFRVDRPRRTIFFATTNDDEYLQSQTGNRRFWPVPVSRVDLAALRADRDQLWAEAVTYEKRGDSIVLPERLWNIASHEQDSRTESDEWSAAIHKYLDMPDKIKADVSITDVLVDNQFLQIEQGRVGRREQMRAGNILRRLGFTKYRKRLAGNAFEYRYKR